MTKAALTGNEQHHSVVDVMLSVLVTLQGIMNMRIGMGIGGELNAASEF